MTPIGDYLINNRRSVAKMYVFIAENLTFKEAEGDAEEDIETFWFTEDEITNMIKAGKIVNCHLLASWAIFNSKK